MTFRWSDYRRFSVPLRHAGVQVPTIRTALKRGIIIKISPGVYRWVSPRQ
jgi:hypothetical protein